VNPDRRVSPLGTDDDDEDDGGGRPWPRPEVLELAGTHVGCGRTFPDFTLIVLPPTNVLIIFVLQRII
jgi:hypothetical protein